MHEVRQPSALTSLGIIGFSLLVLCVALFATMWEPLQKVVAVFMLMFLPVAGIGAAAWFYKQLLPRNPASSPSTIQKRHNWAVLIASIVIGLAVATFLRQLFTHSMVRAFDAVISHDGADD